MYESYRDAVKNISSLFRAFSLNTLIVTNPVSHREIRRSVKTCALSHAREINHALLREDLSV